MPTATNSKKMKMQTKVKTFSIGGAHPPDNKWTNEEPIRKLPLPDKILLPVIQHIGKPAKILVQSGDNVLTGQMVAVADGNISANIHSPVTGQIGKIKDMASGNGFLKKTIEIITAQNEEQWADGIDTSADIRIDFAPDKNQILKQVQKAGIVGMGGAAFPSHVKLIVPDGKKAHTLLINGVECEPYLTADYRLMLEHGLEILIGIQIMMIALDAPRAVIGIEMNKPKAIDHLSDLIRQYNFEHIQVVPLQVKYPQGSEKQLIEAVTKKEVPAKALPIDMGVVVHNTGTAFAVYEAVQKNKPLIARVVTVSGLSITNPANYWVRIGTSIKYLVEASGGVKPDIGKIVLGGPMMGQSVGSWEIPIEKGSSGLLLINESSARRKERNACIRCAKCVLVCCMGLEPYLLYKLSKNDLFDQCQEQLVQNCIECGSCSYICPSGEPLLDYIRLAKKAQ